jgi:outer membrane protein assembly factor BamE (lipoprotein component of BamABCDE complex)
LRIGSSTREEVVRQIGEPLNYNYFSTDFLLYVQKKVESIAFLRPRVTERKVVKLTFNKRSILSRIEFTDEVDRRVFESEQKIVVSEGRKLTFWQQMFGNIGNFSSEQFLD